ncbi:pantoate--beta-alanine ligase [Geovibrio thiophilus]|uniref:Pantothenate synthetase n=1 Tax=Geovibrio thiophilus TaxID=139438 RepID=A0A3R5X2Y0_9BACT|nr:pantoate--beta-alanine ligase [Geovibrio thiophilus]QAR33272.1 pantoate--beta-alanine ligase [Geovibrio thiophilus]
MKIITKISESREEINIFRCVGKRIGFVPTMGYLHEGHLSLVKKCREENDIVVVSIFVNPTQFGAGEDFERYPKDMKNDTDMLQKAGVDFLFAPSAEEMYPTGSSTTISVSGVSDGLCGSSRPGHFDGVALVVTKLLNIIMPNKAYFGMKDYQQLQVIKRFVTDLNMNTKIIGMPIVREADGLAMSSRNVYLNSEERKSALCLSRSFALVHEAIEGGETEVSEVKHIVESFIKDHPHTRIDYAQFVDPETLKPVKDLSRDFLLALAVYVGKTRLIDNNLFKVM